MGRPTIPTHIKETKGTLRKDRMNPDEPKLPVKVPEPGSPLLADMSPLAKQVMPHFATLLADMGVLTDPDAPALRLLCEAFAEGIEARNLIQRIGSPYYATSKPGGDVMYRPHPAVAMAADADRRFVVLANQFGLTPAARAKVSAEIASKTINPFEEI